jgi:hypothetical protein
MRLISLRTPLSKMMASACSVCSRPASAGTWTGFHQGSQAFQMEFQFWQLHAFTVCPNAWRTWQLARQPLIAILPGRWWTVQHSLMGVHAHLCGLEGARTLTAVSLLPMSAIGHIIWPICHMVHQPCWQQGLTSYFHTVSDTVHALLHCVACTGGNPPDIAYSGLQHTRAYHFGLSVHWICKQHPVARASEVHVVG